MLEVSEEIVYSAMRAVLAVAMQESNEYELFSLGMQSFADEFTESVMAVEV